MTESFDPVRLDVYLSREYPEYSRSYLQKLIKDGHVLVDGAPAKSNYKVKPDDEVELIVPEMKELDIQPENIPLDIM